MAAVRHALAHRVELWSAGKSPRAGLIEKWGRGTNRVSEMCVAAGIQPPRFEEITGAAVVTVQVQVGVTGRGQVGSPQVTHAVSPAVTHAVTPAVEALLRLLSDGRSLGNADIRGFLGLKDRNDLLARYLRPALADGLVALTLPDKPRSRFQAYRLTELGRAWLLAQEK